MSNYAIRVKDVSKIYKLYNSNKARFADALGFDKKGKHYKEHYALKHVNIDIATGETVGIIGVNGAGKSTILKIITGVLGPTTGEVEIDGRISALLELGAGFNYEYTGMENVYLNGTMMGYTKEEVDAKLPAILEFADIGDYVYQPVKTYSSGMFVRLAFALAINIDPEILVVDEALSVGDVFFQAKCYQKFDEFKKQGKTILFVSHDLGSIAKYCDRVVLMHHGEKMAEGTPKEMIDLYKKLLVGNDEATETGGANTMEGKTATGKAPAESDDKKWKSNFVENPNKDEYGTGKAEIIDYAIVDDTGKYTNAIIKGTEFQIKTKVKFHEDIKNPIFTYTFKTVKGTEVTGTNTMFERKEVPEAKAGEVYTVTYTQRMDLQGGEYLLSMSCTGYENGEFTAYHRCYDLLSVTVISDKNTVGYYDMNSDIKIEKEAEKEA